MMEWSIRVATTRQVGRRCLCCVGEEVYGRVQDPNLRGTAKYRARAQSACLDETKQGEERVRDDKWKTRDLCRTASTQLVYVKKATTGAAAAAAGDERPAAKHISELGQILCRQMPYLGNSRSTEDETDSRFGAVNYSPHCIPIFLSFFLLFAFLPSFLGG